MSTVFSSVFVHRYRDTRPEIRSLCIAELGVWMKEYSVHFLDDQYLKYIGWTLYDKVSPSSSSSPDAMTSHLVQAADVRLQSVLALQPLYSSTELFPHLDLFTQKFKVLYLVCSPSLPSPSQLLCLLPRSGWFL